MRMIYDGIAITCSNQRWWWARKGCDQSGLICLKFRGFVDEIVDIDLGFFVWDEKTKTHMEENNMVFRERKIGEERERENWLCRKLVSHRLYLDHISFYITDSLAW